MMPLSLVLASSLLAASPSAVDHDVRGYAIAVCLAQQPSPYLKAQGEGWASMIVQRGSGGLAPLRGVAAAVRAETARVPTYRIEDEDRPQGTGEALPIAYCVELVNRPTIRAAVARAEAALAAAYRGRR